VSVTAPGEFAHLMAQVGQLNIVTESNTHLRGENEELAKKVSSARSELEAVRTAAAPLQDSVRKLESEKESLELVNDQLTHDVSYWRSRLSTLVSRYNDVDPEEHRLLKTKLEEATATIGEKEVILDERADALQAATQALTALQSDLKTASEAAAESKEKEKTAYEKEMGALRSQANGSEATATNLRETLRKFKVNP
jgi:nucleoprotein TPR